MRAVAVPAFRAAPSLMEVPEPRLGANELGVRIEAAGMNPFDWKIADGALEGARPHVFPLVMGIDAAGIVERVGRDVRRYQVGDRVFGQFLHDPVGIGTYAPKTVVPESNGISRVPSSLNPAQAAAMPTSGMTALSALDQLGLSRGATVLIVGASGGVGSFAVQLAAAAELRPIVVARASSHARLRTLGAAEAIDATAEALEPRIRALCPSGVDGLLDLMSAGPVFRQMASLVRPGGVAATTVHAADPARAPAAQVRAVNIDLVPSTELLERLARRFEERHLVIPVERRIRLEDAPAAVAEGRAGRLGGKTVIEL